MKNIKFINHSIAFTNGKTIYINKNLKNIPSLYKQILKHEKEHTDNSNYTCKDFIIDSNSEVSLIKLIGFCLLYPSGFWQFLPFYYKNKTFYYSWSIIIKWIILLSVIFITFKIFI